MAKAKEIKLEFFRDGNDCICASIYLVNQEKTKRYMASFAGAPKEKVLTAKAAIRARVAEWVDTHPEWIRVEKEVYESVKPIW